MRAIFGAFTKRTKDGKRGYVTFISNLSVPKSPQPAVRSLVARAIRLVIALWGARLAFHKCERGKKPNGASV